jgi:hypothetical protein
MKRSANRCPGQCRRGSFLKLTAGLFLLCGGVSLVGCSAPAEPTRTMAKIFTDGDQQDWRALQPTLKAHLLQSPNDALGHFLYGLSFLHGADPQLTFAEGEFLTSLNLLDEEDAPLTELGDMERNEFAGLVHQKIALAYMRGCYEARRMGLPQNYGRNLLVKANDQVERGLKANPESGHLLEYSEYLREELQLDRPKTPNIITERPAGGIAI